MINSLDAKTNRGYLSVKELLELLGIAYNSNLETTYLSKIERAEELIDSYLGFVNKFIYEDFTGKALSGTTTTITVNPSYLSITGLNIDYFYSCIVEIVKGKNVGERRVISSSNGDLITVRDAFSSAIDNTSYFKIYQLAKYPTAKDISYVSRDNVIIKTIPENIKRAVAHQVDYMITMGDDYFATDTIYKSSDNLGDLSINYKKDVRFIAPLAKELLKGYVVRTGTIE